MRTVEMKMLAAIRAGKSARISNTEVRSQGDVSLVYLFGNLIANVYPHKLELTLAGWNTVTTRGRLNALLNAFAPPGSGGFNQRDSKAYFNGAPIEPSAWITIDR